MSANLPRMEALVRISNIPIVETSTKTAGKIYNDLKVRATKLIVMSVPMFEGYQFSLCSKGAAY